MENQEKDSNSVLNYYRKLVALRKSPAYREVFTYGRFVPAYEDTESVMAYYRVEEKKRIMVAGNFGKETVELKLDFPVKTVLLSNLKDWDMENRQVPKDILTLESCEVVVLECGSSCI